ncbi:MAG: DUF2062 domain-containing protein [Chitinophagaceae bacterium]|jgi:glycosyltransferase involved in cell wall biosynthesis
MNIDAHLIESLKRHKICIIIPTYNNSKTLQRVVDAVLQFGATTIVVNDGATDSTPAILQHYPQLVIVRHPKNLGKGMALRNGFKKAIELGFHYAITIDSDGQHFASDIPVFIEELEKNGDALLIGSRNMTQEGVPKKSSFGNKFSNFWFWFETGHKLEDTQSGFRLYPLLLIPKKYFTNKFEFEIEVIVRTAWKRIPVKNIPIKVLYDPEERVSHFRPFKDFTRISILNTVLVLITLLYIKPRDVFYQLKKKGLKAFFIENVIKSNDTPIRKSCSIALGVFIGIAPFWGFQTVLALFFATILKLNRAIAFAFSNISIPPFIPFIIYASLLLGRWIVPMNKPLILDNSTTFDAIKTNLTQYLFGSFILASLMGLLFGVLSYFILTGMKTMRKQKI